MPFRKRATEVAVDRDFERLHVLELEAVGEKARRKSVPLLQDAVRERTGKVSWRQTRQGVLELAGVPKVPSTSGGARASVRAKLRSRYQRAKPCRRVPAPQLVQVRERAYLAAVLERVKRQEVSGSGRVKQRERGVLHGVQLLQVRGNTTCQEYNKMNENQN